MTSGRMRWVWIQRVRNLQLPRDVLETILDRVAERLQVPPQTVTIVLTGDRTIARLKGRFLGEHRPTDVLAFPMHETFPDGETYLGDIVISVPTARRQAAARGHTLVTELAILLVHGFLHLLGYDHTTDQGEMVALERTILEDMIRPYVQMGVGDPVEAQ